MKNLPSKETEIKSNILFGNKHDVYFIAPGTKQKPLKWLIDATIGYPGNIDLNGLTIIAGTRKPCNVTVHYRKFPISELPLDAESLTKWMYDRYEEKEAMLEIFHTTGKFPKWNEETMEIDQNVLLPNHRPLRHCEYRVTALKIFYLILLYLTCSIFVGSALQAKVFTLTVTCVLYHIFSIIIHQFRLKMWFLLQYFNMGFKCSYLFFTSHVPSDSLFPSLCLREFAIIINVMFQFLVIYSMTVVLGNICYFHR